MKFDVFSKCQLINGRDCICTTILKTWDACKSERTVYGNNIKARRRKTRILPSRKAIVSRNNSDLCVYFIIPTHLHAPYLASLCAFCHFSVSYPVINSLYDLNGTKFVLRVIWTTGIANFRISKFNPYSKNDV